MIGINPCDQPGTPISIKKNPFHHEDKVDTHSKPLRKDKMPEGHRPLKPPQTSKTYDVNSVPSVDHTKNHRYSNQSASKTNAKLDKSSDTTSASVPPKSSSNGDLANKQRSTNKLPTTQDIANSKQVEKVETKDKRQALGNKSNHNLPKLLIHEVRVKVFTT